MCECIRCVRATPLRGLLQKPLGSRNGKDCSFKFIICGRLDSNYATDPESRKSITGTVLYMNDAPIYFSSVTQKHEMLPVTEAELVAVVTMIQVVNSMGLYVELFMVAKIDNSGTYNLANSWRIGG